MKNKNELRKEILNIRNKISRQVVADNSFIITNKIINMDIYKKSRAVFIYMSFKNEVSTSFFTKQMLADGKTVLIPFTDKKNTMLIPCEITDDKDLSLNDFGYYEPREPIIYPVEKIDLVIVPGVVFDEKLNRIGYGKGYYDRILRRTRQDVQKIAIAHDFQVLDIIPAEPHDIKMDMIVTEKRVIED